MAFLGDLGCFLLPLAVRSEMCSVDRLNCKSLACAPDIHLLLITSFHVRSLDARCSLNLQLQVPLAKQFDG